MNCSANERRANPFAMPSAAYNTEINFINL